MTRLADTARETIARHRLIPAGAPVLVMVSGGGDSVTLLRLFAVGELGDHPLRVLHLNHLIRDESADADEAFVRSLCAELAVDCRIVRYDVSAWAREAGLNLEDAGRRIRYRFADEELDAFCADEGLPGSAGRIAVAHTLDDRIETFFMRAIAGSGTGALGSIAASRGRIVRPLLDCERADVRAYLDTGGFDWREDESNTDTQRSRALVRAEMLPVAARLNPAFRVSLARTMDLLADDDALLSRMAQGFARDFAEVHPGEIRFNRQWMRTLERTMARRTVRSALSVAFPDASRLEAAHVEAIVDGLAEEGFARDLPGGLRAFTEYATLVVSHSVAESRRVAPSLLTLPGHADLGAVGEIVAEAVDPADVTGDPRSVVIDADQVSDGLTVDSVREGDRMRPLGMEGSRKLSDMLVDAKIPRRHRDAVPVVRDGERIVWLAGVRMSDEYRISGATARAVRLTWQPSEAVDQAADPTGAGE